MTQHTHNTYAKLHHLTLPTKTSSPQMDQLLAWFETLTRKRPQIFNVPSNTDAILDFNDPTTPESQAKCYLQSQAAHHNTVALVGMGGCGKTTRLRQLAHLPQICSQFQHGIWFIQLGQDATVQSLLRQFRALVQRTFPRWLPHFEQMSASEEQHDTLIIDLVDRLSAKHFLVIFDNVADDRNGVYKLVARFCSQVCSLRTNRFKVLTSTRSVQVSLNTIHDKIVDVNASVGHETARKILCHYAAIDISAIDDFSPTTSEAFHDIIARCHCLPLALAVAGTSVRRAITQQRKNHEHNVWVQYCSSLRRNMAQLGNAVGPDHDGLFASLKSSVQFLATKCGNADITIRQVVSSLCVLQKQMWIPLDDLAAMWHVDYSRAESILDLFADNNLCSCEFSDDGNVKGLRLHDLVHEFCTVSAVENEGTRHWHAMIVEKYCRELGTDEYQGHLNLDSFVKKRHFNTAGYIEDNLIRHLLGAGREEHALALLIDYRWIQFINSDHSRPPFEKVIADLVLLQQCLDKNKDNGKQSLTHDIDLVIDTMLLCMVPHCTKNRRECTFQLYGRLVSLRTDSQILSQLMHSVETYAERPWVRAGPGVLKSAGSGLKRALHARLRFKLTCMQLGMADGELVVAGDAGELRVIDRRDASEIHDLNGHDDHIVGVCVDTSSRKMYSCSTDGVLILWKDYICERVVRVISDGDERSRNSAACEITCMSLLQKQGIIVLGTSLGQLKILNIDSGTIIRSISSGDRVVLNLATESTEKVIASASYNTIRLWNTETWDQIGEKLANDLSHASFCIAMSSDGTLIASGSDSGFVYLWDLRQDRRKYILEAPNSGWMDSLVFSRDGTVLYSGGLRVINVWNVSNLSNGADLMYSLRDHRMTRVVSLFLSEDESELFQFSHPSDIVFAWRTQRRMDICSDFKESDAGFLDNVTASGVSANGLTLVTYCESSRRVQLHDAEDACKMKNQVIAEFKLKTEDSGVHLIAVSDDQAFIAYTLYFENSAIYVVDVRNEATVQRLQMLDNRLQAVEAGQDEHSAEPLRATAMRFNHDGTCLVAKVMNFKTERVRDFAWSTLTGEQKSSADAERLGKSFDDDGEIVAATRIVCRGNDDFFRVVLQDRGNTHAVGTLERNPAVSSYSAALQRMWMWGRHDGRVHWMDLISSTSEETPPKQAPIFAEPSVRNKGSSQKTRKGYSVFISHAGPDKLPIAQVIYDELIKLGFTVFLDKNELEPGEDAWNKMNEAMETASIAVVILSPEFAARKWTMKELMCFMRRFEEGGEEEIVIISAFYRLSLDECKDVSAIVGKLNKDGENVFEKERVWQRLAEEGGSVKDIFETLSKLGRITGIENLEMATNDSGVVEEEKRRRFAMRVVDGIVQARARSSGNED